MTKEKVTSWVKLILVLILVYFFLVSIGLMSASFKGFGKKFAEALLSSTSNPFIALFIGILATSLVQSSSTTTSIVVGMVASGVLSIQFAIPIMMGANIGTTVTNTLVSLGHITRKEEFKRAIAGATVHDFFNLICVAIMFPLNLMTGFLEKMATWLADIFVNAGGIKFTSPIKVITKPLINFIKHFFLDTIELQPKLAYSMILLVSIIILFLALYFIVKVMKSLVIEKTEIALNNVLNQSAHLGILAGLIFTVIVQSSSITTSLLIPLIGAGIINLELAFPVTMGANIGTTTTAILASFATGNVAAITIAFVHFLFNIIGVVFIYPIKIFRKIPIKLALSLGELADKNRIYALLYVLGMFFIVPVILITISKLLK